jgi:large subunit ribosomal protein L15
VLVKVLGNGEIDRALNVKVHKFSASAREKILAAGGTAEELSLEESGMDSPVDR